MDRSSFHPRTFQHDFTALGIGSAGTNYFPLEKLRCIPASLLIHCHHFLPKKGKSVTHVSGTICYPCRRSLTRANRKRPVCRSVSILFCFLFLASLVLGDIHSRWVRDAWRRVSECQSTVSIGSLGSFLDHDCL